MTHERPLYSNDSDALCSMAINCTLDFIGIKKSRSHSSDLYPMANNGQT